MHELYIHETFYRERIPDFVISSYLVLLSSIVTWNIFLNEVASNAFNGTLF